MEWYYADGGRQIGPHSDEVFRQLVSEGRVTASALVWHEGMANWQPLSEVAGMLGSAAGAEGGEPLAIHDF